MSHPPTSRRIAWQILNQVEQHGAWAEEILPGKVAAAKLPEAEARLCRELVFGAVKARGFLDYALRPLWKAGSPPTPGF